MNSCFTKCDWLVDVELANSQPFKEILSCMLTFAIFSIHMLICSKHPCFQFPTFYCLQCAKTKYLWPMFFENWLLTCPGSSEPSWPERKRSSAHYLTYGSRWNVTSLLHHMLWQEMGGNLTALYVLIIVNISTLPSTEYALATSFASAPMHGATKHTESCHCMSVRRLSVTTLWGLVLQHLQYFDTYQHSMTVDHFIHQPGAIRSVLCHLLI